MPKSLIHVGILGMHWGRRKGSSSSGRSKTPHSPDHLAVAAIRKKRLNQLSNDEIRKVTERLQLENKYSLLTPSKMAKGHKSFTQTMLTLGEITAGAATIASLYGLGKTYMGKYTAHLAQQSANKVAKEAMRAATLAGLGW